MKEKQNTCAMHSEVKKANAQMGQGMMGNSGTAWGTGVFRSNGERIYFTATSERGTEIAYTGGPGHSTGLCARKILK
jgi:hypothetical protein